MKKLVKYFTLYYAGTIATYMFLVALLCVLIWGCVSYYMR